MQGIVKYRKKLLVICFSRNSVRDFIKVNALVYKDNRACVAELYGKRSYELQIIIPIIVVNNRAYGYSECRFSFGFGRKLASDLAKAATHFIRVVPYCRAEILTENTREIETSDVTFKLR